jgi:hypothetical protein
MDANLGNPIRVDSRLFVVPLPSSRQNEPRMGTNGREFRKSLFVSIRGSYRTNSWFRPRFRCRCRQR